MVGRRRSLRLRLRRQWSELQGELLELILEKLDLANHARFASVCSSWRSVAINNPPINKPLYMVLSHRPSHLIRRFITSFIPSWEKKATFIGAGLDGWLVILIDGRDLFLLNKGSNSIIPLPPLEQGFFLENSKAVLSSPPSSSSSAECTVVIKHFYAGVFYCRTGSDKSFTELSNIPHWPEDILFYEEQLYVICKYNTIIIFDHLLNKTTQLVARFGKCCSLFRLLISENRLLFVGTKPGHYYVLTLKESKQRVIRVNNIDDKLMFIVNHYCSLSISTKEHNEFRRTETANYYNYGFSTFILDTSEDPNKAKGSDPWPLFFVMFNRDGIKHNVVW